MPGQPCYHGEFVRNRTRPKKPHRIAAQNAGSNKAELKQDKLHKDLAAFEDYQTILASIRNDLKRGMTEKQLQLKYAPLAQARIISEMLTSDNAGAALAAAKDLLDRINGKATEKKEVSHRFADMSDKELDAILKSEEEELKVMNERFDQ